MGGPSGSAQATRRAGAWLRLELDAGFGVVMRAFAKRPGFLPSPTTTPQWREPGSNRKQMKTRIIIEYDLPAGDHVMVRDPEE